jgi:hypothetical protein
LAITPGDKVSEHIVFRIGRLANLNPVPASLIVHQRSEGKASGLKPSGIKTGPRVLSPGCRKGKTRDGDKAHYVFTHRLGPRQSQSVRETGFGLYLFAILGTGAVLLQFCNIATLNAFWLFFTGIVVRLLAMFQSARTILLTPEARQRSRLTRGQSP